MITTQKDFFTEVAKKADTTQKAVHEVYDAMIETIVESANSADDTKTIIPEIGFLLVTPKEAYIGKNPKTGEKIQVEATRRTRVRIAPKFSERFLVAKAAPAKKATVAKKTVKKK